MKTRIINITMLAIFIVTLGGCQYELVKKDSQKTLSEDFLFKKKQECASYRTDMEQKLAKLDFENKNVAVGNDLDEIWFSPSINSCLYSVNQLWQYLKDGKFEREYSIYDYLGNKLLFHASEGLNESAFDVFEKRKEELKKYFYFNARSPIFASSRPSGILYCCQTSASPGRYMKYMFSFWGYRPSS